MILHLYIIYLCVNKSKNKRGRHHREDKSIFKHRILKSHATVSHVANPGLLLFATQTSLALLTNGLWEKQDSNLRPSALMSSNLM